MRVAIAPVIVSIAFASIATGADAAEKCFDKGALAYVDCAPAFAWSGFYFGGHGGYAETDDEDPEGTFNSVVFDELQSDGGAFGVMSKPD